MSLFAKKKKENEDSVCWQDKEDQCVEDCLAEENDFVESRSEWDKLLGSKTEMYEKEIKCWKRVSRVWEDMFRKEKEQSSQLLEQNQTNEYNWRLISQNESLVSDLEKEKAEHQKTRELYAEAIETNLKLVSMVMSNSEDLPHKEEVAVFESLKEKEQKLKTRNFENIVFRLRNIVSERGKRIDELLDELDEKQEVIDHMKTEQGEKEEIIRDYERLLKDYSVLFEDLFKKVVGIETEEEKAEEDETDWGSYAMEMNGEEKK